MINEMIKNIVNSWITNEGYPYLTVEKINEPEYNLKITQNRFFVNN